MDPNSTPQTVAQAVQAATQQQQQQISQPSPPVQPPQGPVSAIDNLTCQWQGCGERTDTAETLYDHVCERHVGRKSTNNLNLTCQWGACRTTTVKRDHITSHIRVHVPLKPHKCDFCGKAFKRPQDLKKHVKTHADDSVLSNSPGQGQNGRGAVGNTNGLGQPNGKSEYNPAYQTLASALADHVGSAAASNYYNSDGQMGNPYPNYQTSMGANTANGNGYPQHNGNGQYAGYGSVSYPNSTAGADLQSMDTRKRAIEALNDFLGDIKRRAINPSSYYDVGQRLGSSNALPLPVGTGYNTGYNNTTTGFSNLNAASLLESFNQGHDIGGNAGGMHNALATQTYSLPVPNARSKDDLQEIDRFLEQLQHTVYEASNTNVATGVQAPGVHTQFGSDFGYGSTNHYNRSSNSPPNYQNNGSGVGTFGGLTAATMPGMTSSTSALDTPALTPASVSSYTSSGQSPMSSHGGRSSLGNGMNSNAMYPNLPSVTGMSDLGSGYPTTTSAPASALAPGFEGHDSRRYSGGRLQRQAPGQDSEMTDVDDSGSRTPKQSDEKRPKSKGNSSIDPALRGEDSSDSASTPAARSADGDEKRQEDWIENIRTIEAIRRYITDRLQRGDYEDNSTATDGDAVVSDAKAGAEDDTAAKMAETAKMVMADEKMADVEAEVRPQAMAQESSDVKYPTLPGA